MGEEWIGNGVGILWKGKRWTMESAGDCKGCQRLYEPDFWATGAAPVPSPLTGERDPRNPLHNILVEVRTNPYIYVHTNTNYRKYD